MAGPTLKSALLYFEQRKGLDEADRAHLKRWLTETRNPVWEQIAADARKCKELPPLIEGPYSYFIGSALRARRSAESKKDPPHLEMERREQRQQQKCREMLELAAKMEEVVSVYPRFTSTKGPPKPGPDIKPLPREPSEADRSIAWLGREALNLRKRGQQVRSGDMASFWNDWDYVPVTVSRQRGGKGKRSRSRELGVFMRTMVNAMHRACRKPSYSAVAEMTNIAFSEAEVDSEDVRSACRRSKQEVLDGPAHSAVKSRRKSSRVRRGQFSTP
jgi:hypothetical protein